MPFLEISLVLLYKFWLEAFKNDAKRIMKMTTTALLVHTWKTIIIITTTTTIIILKNLPTEIRTNHIQTTSDSIKPRWAQAWSNLIPCPAYMHVSNRKADGTSPELDPGKGCFLITEKCCFFHFFGMSCSSDFQIRSSATTYQHRTVWEELIKFQNV